jgi:hypothetical protein
MRLHFSPGTALEAARPTLAMLAIAALSGLAPQAALAENKKPEPIVNPGPGRLRVRRRQHLER